MDVREARILYVEDSADDVFFFERALKKLCPGIKLAVLTDGESAVRYLSGEGPYRDRTMHPLPSHAVLDLKLPRRNGLEVLEWVRRRSPLASLPVAILTSSQQHVDAERARSLGIDGYHVKPVNFLGLLETMRSMLSRWELLGTQERVRQM